MLNNFRATLKPSTWKEKERTIIAVASCGKPGPRKLNGRKIIESLDLNGADLTRLNSGKASVLDSHDRSSLDKILGVVETAWLEDGKDGKPQLLVKIKFSSREEKKGIIQDIKEGIISQVSIGYKPLEYRDISGPSDIIRHMLCTKLDIHEVSFLAVNFDPDSVTRADQNIHMPTVTKVEKDEQDMKKCKKCSKDSDALIDGVCQNCITAEEQTRGNQDDTDNNILETPAVLAAIREATEKAAEKARADLEAQNAAQNAFKKKIYAHADELELTRSFADELLERGLEEADLYREMAIKLKSSGNKPPRSYGSFQSGPTAKEKAHERVEKAIDARFMGVTSETDREVSGLMTRGFSEIAREIVGIEERDARYFDDSEVLTRAMETTNFPILLGDSARKYFVDYYEGGAPVWRPLVQETDTKDLKEIKNIKLGGFGSLVKQTSEDQAYPAINTPTEEFERNLVDTYLGMILITRKLLINDDMNGIMSRIHTAADACANLEETLFYQALMTKTMEDGKTLIHSDHENILTKAHFGFATLKAARKHFRLVKNLPTKDKDGNLTDGRPMKLSISYCYVPANLEDLAERYFGPFMLPTEVKNKNPYEGIKYIVDGGLDYYDENTSYFFSNKHKAVQMAYYKGNRVPFTARKQDFDTDCLKIKVRHEVGSAPLDHRFVLRHEHDPNQPITDRPINANIVNEMLDVNVTGGSVDANVTNESIRTEVVT